MGLQMRLQPYNFVVKHTPGKTKIAEPLSRLTIKVEESAFSAENYICYVAVGATPNAMSTIEIEGTSITFSETQQFFIFSRENKWNNLRNKR